MKPSLPPPPPYTERAFSLVELSVVLVIIGLIVGGVVAAHSLIRAAELRSVVSDFTRYEAAVLSFRDKYRALPGDMTNATMFWGAADGGDGLGADCADATSSNGTTCNGNGNGQLETVSEWYSAWLQLADAGLVEGSYTGRRTADPQEATPGINVPVSPMDGGGYTLLSTRPFDGNPLWYSGDYNPALALGKNMVTNITYGAILTAAEAYRIDSKLDDGRPGLGRVRALLQVNCADVAGEAAQATAAYLATGADVACMLVYSFNDPGE